MFKQPKTTKELKDDIVFIYFRDYIFQSIYFNSLGKVNQNDKMQIKQLVLQVLGTWHL